ncbi:aminodeoxychorismate synthase component I [Pseudomonas sp. CNPSo 3701]|uniref:aminodeoxychorismate synthase component I n=1 Tax=Pseudomonas sp. CNPSo 3701 TaxID=3027943 RepID=UPI0023639BC6|nr:aminodeoxychorismate synthase component I [Pseudomonas sp. CNPSo 3701]MDD1508191.1 aminodeoxychorismate synthase component I [Pseudomonas sp. CNPSo 3701]
MPICLVHRLPYQADPAVYFQVVRQAPGAVLLDAGKPVASRGRFDLLSAWPQAELTPAQDESGATFFARLREQLAALGAAELPADIELPFAGGLLGYLAYDFGRRIEALPEQALDDLGLSDAVFGLYAWALITDHQKQSSQLVFHPSLPEGERARLLALFEHPAQDDEGPQPFVLLAPFRANIEQACYAEAIGRIQAYIGSGDCYQVNYAQRFQAPYEGDPWRAYVALRSACPTPFSGYLTLPGGGTLLSLSPERFMRLSGGQVETRPIKGTQPRGRDEQEDARNAQVLLTSIKDRAENLMIVDLLRNDLGRSCRIGSVRVPELFSLESYPNVHHLVSAVTGELAADRDALDLLLGAFPGGSITGAPKIRAMQIIDELEPTRRGPYCGSLLYLDVRGEMDSSIAIRSLLAKDGVISCWGGGGIVADSAWQAEYQESITKVQVLLSTLESFFQSKR